MQIGIKNFQNFVKKKVENLQKKNEKLCTKKSKNHAKKNTEIWFDNASCILAILRCACIIRGASRWRMPALAALLDRGRAVRNLVGRAAGALRGRNGLKFDIHQIP